MDSNPAPGSTIGSALWFLSEVAFKWIPGIVLSMAGVGVLGNLVCQALFMQGLKWTAAGNAALFLNMSPLWAALLALRMGADRLEARTWYGILLAMVGAASKRRRVTLPSAGRGSADRSASRLARTTGDSTPSRT